MESKTTSELDLSGFNHLVRRIDKRLSRDYDAMVGICGDEGTGKTVLAHQIAKALAKRRGVPYSLKNNMILNPTVDAILDKIFVSLPKYSPIIVDEAIKTMYKRSWQDKVQIELNKKAGIWRKKNKPLFLCMPALKDFDSYWREHRLMIVVQILERGTAVVFRKDKFAFAQDKWHVDDNTKIWDKFCRRVPMGSQTLKFQLAAYKRFKNFDSIIHWSDFSPEDKAEYLKLVEESSQDFATVETENLEGKAAQYKNWLGKSLELLFKKCAPDYPKQSDLADALGMPLSSLNVVLKERKLRPVDLRTGA